MLMFEVIFNTRSSSTGPISGYSVGSITFSTTSTLDIFRAKGGFLSFFSVFTHSLSVIWRGEYYVEIFNSQSLYHTIVYSELAL